MSETKVENRIKTLIPEKSGVIENIRNTINDIRNGVRSSISGIFGGLGILLKKGFDRMLGVKTQESANMKEKSQAANENNPIQTGSNETSPTEAQTTTESKPETPKLQEVEAFNRVAKLVADNKIKKILYPFCGYHSINTAFPDAKVTYLDEDEKAVQVHKESDQNAEILDAKNPDPELKPDLTVLLNPSADHRKIEKILKNTEPDKLVLTAYYPGAALLMGKKEFVLEGVIPPDAENLVSEELESYTKKRIRPEDALKYSNHHFIFRKKAPDTTEV